MSGILGAFCALFFKPAPARHIERPTTVDEPATPGAGVKCTILAIDDDQTFLDTLRPLLRTEGFNVMTAISGAKGLDMLRFTKSGVQVVVLDFNMPRLTGLDTLQHVRKLMPKAKVLGLSGLPPKELPDDFRNSVDRLMTKPYLTTELVACINDMTAVEEESLITGAM